MQRTSHGQDGGSPLISELHGHSMITEYELYSDERRMPPPHRSQMLLGGIVCTSAGRARLLEKLAAVRSKYNLAHEMKWAKVSRAFLEAYRAWVDVFFDDPFARFSLLIIDQSSRDWSSFQPRLGRRTTLDDRLASAFYQFLLVTLAPLRDTKRWSVYPDAGLFARESVLQRIEFLFNRTYKKAFGRRTSRIIRFARSRDSGKTDLVQVADVLLGSFGSDLLGVAPSSEPRATLVHHCAQRIRSMTRTRTAQSKLAYCRWVHPDRFSYGPCEVSGAV